MNGGKWVGLRARLIIGLVAGAVAVVIISTGASAYVAQPKLELIFNGYETNQNYRLAKFTIRNVGSAAAMYRGYSKETPNCDVVHISPSGVSSGRFPMCGTGLRDCVLLPGEQITTEEAIVEEGNWKMSLRYRKPTLYDRLPAEIQSWLPLPEPAGPLQKVSTPEMGRLPHLSKPPCI